MDRSPTARARCLSLDSGQYVASSDVIVLVCTDTDAQPFNHGYLWNNVSANYAIGNDSNTELNSYLGGVYQQATSALSWTSEHARYVRNCRG